MKLYLYLHRAATFVAAQATIESEQAQSEKGSRAQEQFYQPEPGEVQNELSRQSTDQGGWYDGEEHEPGCALKDSNWVNGKGDKRIRYLVGQHLRITKPEGNAVNEYQK